MTAYRNFIEDFPARCSEILGRHHPAAEQIGREVTLLLSVASAAIVVPFERLRPAAQNRPPHVLGDRQELGATVQKFDSLLKGRFLGSDVWPKNEALSWQYAKMPITRIQADPEDWTDEVGNRLVADDCSAVDADQTCNDILLTIRNALAHGNIKTFPNDATPIKKIVFLSTPSRPKPTDFATIVAVTPRHLADFLKNWVRFLGALKMPGGVDGEVAWVTPVAA